MAEKQFMNMGCLRSALFGAGFVLCFKVLNIWLSKPLSASLALLIASFVFDSIFSRMLEIKFDIGWLGFHLTLAALVYVIGYFVIW